MFKRLITWLYGKYVYEPECKKLVQEALEDPNSIFVSPEVYKAMQEKRFHTEQ